MDRLLPLLAAFALLLGAHARPAEAADDVSVCHKSSGPEALAACDRAIASGGYTGLALARLHTSRGVERRRAKDIEGAIADYDAAIKINPKDQFAFNNRANLQRDKGDLERAIADYSEAIRIDPGYTAAYVNRGLVYESLKDLDRARADYQQVLAMPPRYANGPGGQEVARKRLAALANVP